MKTLNKSSSFQAQSSNLKTCENERMKKKEKIHNNWSDYGKYCD